MTWTILTLWGARLVLVILVGLSVWSVAVMIDRKRVLDARDRAPDTGEWKARVQKIIAERNWAALAPALNGRQELSAGALLSALQVSKGSRESVELSVKSYLAQERVTLEKGFTVLATLGSNAPFIGLFGTVLGIIQAFAALSGDGSGGPATGAMTSVMSSISEALVATAIGLFVAIPAVVAYNVFSRRLRLMIVECESLRDFYLSRLGD